MKRYKSVISMVKDLSEDKEFVKSVEKTIKENTVYVLILENVFVFKTLKLAKEYVRRVVEKEIVWKSTQGMWNCGDIVIHKRQIVKA